MKIMIQNCSGKRNLVYDSIEQMKIDYNNGHKMGWDKRFSLQQYQTVIVECKKY